MKRFIRRGLKISQSRVLTLRKWNYSHNLLVLFVLKTNTVNVFYWNWKILSPDWKARGLHSTVIETKLPELLLCKSKRVDSTIKEEIASFIFNDMVNKRPWLFYCMETTRGDEWSLRAFASMPNTAIFLRAWAEIKNCFASLRTTQKFGEHKQASRRLNVASKSSKGKFCEQLKILMDHSSPLLLKMFCPEEDWFVRNDYQNHAVECVTDSSLLIYFSCEKKIKYK